MSLRSISDQIDYERWADDVIDACRAAGVQPPTDFAMRWYRGEQLRDIVNERLVAAGKPLLPESAGVATGESERRLSGERGGNARAKAGVHSQTARVRHAAGSRSSDGSDTLLPNPNTVKPERVRA